MRDLWLKVPGWMVAGLAGYSLKQNAFLAASLLLLSFALGVFGVWLAKEDS